MPGQFVGTINWLAGTGSPAVAGPSGTEAIRFNLNGPSIIGDWVEVYSYKGKWYVTGECLNNDAVILYTP